MERNFEWFLKKTRMEFNTHGYFSYTIEQSESLADSDDSIIEYLKKYLLPSIEKIKGDS